MNKYKENERPLTTIAIGMLERKMEILGNSVRRILWKTFEVCGLWFIVKLQESNPVMGNRFKISVVAETVHLSWMTLSLNIPKSQVDDPRIHMNKHLGEKIKIFIASVVFF